MMYTLNTFVYKADHLFGVQNYDLLPIDYVQGKVDMNFAFFFDVPPYNSQHLDTNCFRESLIKTIKSFPILTGHIVNAAEQGTNWKVHVDPSNINWPEVTESTAPVTIDYLKEWRFRWDKWPRKTEMIELHLLSSQPLFAAHIVQYACGGFSLPTKVRHQVMDGNGLFMFYQTWAQICSSMFHGKPAISFKLADYPLFSRLIFTSKLGLTGNFKTHKSALDSAPSTSIARIYRYMSKLEIFLRQLARYNNQIKLLSSIPSRMHKFSVSQDALNKLKTNFKTITACSPANTFFKKHKIEHVTTNDLLLALFWQTTTHAHERIAPKNPYTCIGVACNTRKQIGLPETYTGNASLPLPIHLSKKLMRNYTTTDTAAYIRYHINLLLPEYVRQMSSFMASAKSTQLFAGLFHSNTTFFMTSVMSGYPIYQQTNFGADSPIHIDIPAYLAPGCSIWMPTNPNLHTDECMHIDFALRDDVFELVTAGAEFRRFVDIIC